MTLNETSIKLPAGGNFEIVNSAGVVQITGSDSGVLNVYGNAIYMGDSTGDAGTIYANVADSTPYLRMTGLGDARVQLASNATFFKLYNNTLATIVNTTRDSPCLDFTGHSWLGGASVETPLLLYSDVFSLTAPQSRLRISTGGYTASIMPAQTGAVFQGGILTGADCILKANEADLTPYLLLEGNSNTSLHFATTSEFGIFNDDPATAGVTTKDSPTLTFTGHYWTGAMSADNSIRLKGDVISTTPPYIQFEIGTTAGGSTIIRPDLTESKIFGGDATNDEVWVYANSVDDTPYLHFVGNGDAEIMVDGGNNISFGQPGIPDTYYLHINGGAFTFPYGGDTQFSTEVALGVSRRFLWDIQVGAGGAAGAALDYQYKVDDVLEAGLLSETNGAGGHQDSVWKIPYKSGDYGAAWAGFVPPAPASLANGSMVSAYNTNGAGDHRLYVYSNAGWHYTTLT